MSGRKKTNIVILDQSLVSGVNFLTGLLLARFLGPEGYGYFVLAYGIILFVSGIQVALIISPMMVTVPKLDVSDTPRYLRSVTLQQSLFSLATLVFTGVSVLILSIIMRMPQLGALALPVSFTAFTFCNQDYVRRLLIVTDRSIHAFINDFISYGLQLGFLIYWLTFQNQSVYSVFWIVAGTSAIAIAHGVLASRSLMIRDPIRESQIGASFKSTLTRHWDFGKWLIARSITYWGSSQFLIYLAGAMLSATSVGALTATRNIIGFANILFLAMENFVPSRAAAMLKQRGRVGLRKYLLRVSLLGGFLTGLVVMAASIAPEFWLRLVYGRQYTSYSWLVIGWSIFYIIGFFHRPLSAGLRALDKTRDIFLATFIGMIATVVIGYPAITLFDIKGVMLSLICIQTLVLISLFLRLYTAISP